MATKKEARESSHSTGNKDYSNKDTKRKRIITYELVRKWTKPTNVLMYKNILP